ncbi:MAG: yhjG3 [Actinobacteria bacterium]|nr:yhjG3 [Actinomycetota bacterium]
MFGELLEYDEPLRHIGEMLQGSDIRYAMGTGGPRPHPLLGRFAPDLRLETDDGRTRVAELMRPARPVLVDLTPDAALAGVAADWRNRVTVVTGRCRGPTPPAGLLIRPDAYVAWVTESSDPDPAAGLHDALCAWFGPPSWRGPDGRRR